MRRYQKWFTTLGLLAMTPGATFAGPFNFGKKSPTPPIRPVAAQQSDLAVTRESSPNQKTARAIGEALHKGGLGGTDIGIRFKEGNCLLEGTVTSLAQKAAATKAASGVRGVDRVENRLRVADAPVADAGVEQALGLEGYSGADRRQPIRQLAMQDAAAAAQEPGANPAAGQPPTAPPQGRGVGPTGPMGPMQPNMPPPFVPSSVPAPPGYGYGGGPSATVYNQPNFPNHAWPSYAAYPNYAQVNYPKQYSASAWPYIGPFYPYPQVPLGWRAAQLEWDDGFWNLNFRPRTDRWWWFMDYRNW